MNVQIHEIFSQFSSSMLQKIKEQSSLDAELNALKEMIHAGWPAHIQQFPTPLKPYWPYRDELATEDRIVMKAHRIIIPATLQKEILTKLHAPHQGTERTKLRARTSVYWRGLYKDIEETTKTCSTCEELQHNQQKEPLITTEVKAKSSQWSQPSWSRKWQNQTLTCRFFVWELLLLTTNFPHLPSYYWGAKSKTTSQGRFQGTHQVKKLSTGWSKDSNCRNTTMIDLQSHSQNLPQDKGSPFKIQHRWNGNRLR